MKRPRLRSIALLGICVLAAAAALYVAFRPQPVPVRVARATRGPLMETVEEDGRTRIREPFLVSAPVSGRLRRIELEPGDPVTAGRTTLATLEPADPNPIDARSRTEREARVRSAEAQVRLTGPLAERARAASELAQTELARAESLSRQRAIAKQELDRAQEHARAASQDVLAAEYSREIAVSELEQARASLLAAPAADAGADCAGQIRLVSPVDGRVLRRFHQSEAVVVAGERLLELGDPADLEVEIDVLSSDAARIRPGARVLFEQWGGPKALEGRVRVVEPAGFLKISALGVEEQRVNVIVDFVTPAGERLALGDAYRVEARIVVWEGLDVLKIPTSALFRHGDSWSLFAVRAGRSRLTAVQIAHGNSRETEIVSGLSPGDLVIEHPSDRLSDGVRVVVRDGSGN